MLRKLLAFAAIAVFVLGVGCSGGSSPTMPDKGSQTIEDYFNSLDPITSEAVAEATYTDLDGNVICSALIGRDDNGDLYVMETRSAQDCEDCVVDWTCMCLMHVWVIYKNPAGTIMTGPYAGLPYYYIGQTVDYDVCILSLYWGNIGGWDPPFGWAGPANFWAEMHYASIDAMGRVIAGGLMPGAPTWHWTGIITPGYQCFADPDGYYIPGGTIPGLNVTTVKVMAPVLMGNVCILFFDCVAGIWDPQ